MSGSPDSNASLSTPSSRLSLFKQAKKAATEVHPDLLNRAAKAILDRETEAMMWIDSKRSAQIDFKVNEDTWYLNPAGKYETMMVFRYYLKI